MTRFYYEDVTVGERRELGSVTVERQDMLLFSRTFDPQSIHVDEAYAAGTEFKELIASGAYSCAILMRLFCEQFLLHAASVGSPGLREVKWLRPVKAGDRLSGSITATEKRELKSRPGLGLVRMTVEISNEKGEPVTRWDGAQIFLGLRGGQPAAGDVRS